jgi:hypothetical protein
LEEKFQHFSVKASETETNDRILEVHKPIATSNENNVTTIKNLLLSDVFNKSLKNNLGGVVCVCSGHRLRQQNRRSWARYSPG